MEATKTLIEAIRTNDAGQVAAMLERHPEWKATLNEPVPGGAFGGTALIAAVNHRNREMIDVLLGAGADINARSDWWAGSFGVLDSDSGLEDFLIERGARVDAHAAARLGRLDRLKELIAADPAVVHARGGDGQTPLHFAASVAIAEYLLANGADIDAVDIDHESTPAQYMARKRQEVARHLVSRGCRTDLLLAAALGDLNRVRRHIDADPSTIRMSVSEDWFPKRNPRAGGSIYIWVLGPNKTAHHVAHDFGHEEILRWLMERTPAGLKFAVECELGIEGAAPPASIEEPDKRRLVAVAQSNNTENLRRMLDAGFPVDAQTADNVTALHWAGFHGNAGMARELIGRGAPLEVEDATHGGTPIGWAIYGSRHGWYCKTGDYGGVVRALLGAGAEAPEGPVEASEAVLAVLGKE